MENGTSVSTPLKIKNPVRKSVTVIFEFSVLKPKVIVYRGVQATDGSFRMEKRGLNAKKFKPFMWCGSRESLYRYQELVQVKPKNPVGRSLPYDGRIHFADSSQMVS